MPILFPLIALGIVVAVVMYALLRASADTETEGGPTFYLDDEPTLVTRGKDR